MWVLLVARNDWSDGAIYQELHVLPATWRWFTQSASTPNCGHCSIWPPTDRFYQHRDDHGAKTNHLESPTSWCSRTISWSMLWHMWPPIRLLKQLPISCIILIFGALARLTLWAASWMKCVCSSAWKNCGPHCTTHKPMGWWRDHIRP